MHFIIIFASLIIAWSIRRTAYFRIRFSGRWRQTLFLFLFPPLLVFTTALALLCMGTQGQMGNWQTDSKSYTFAIGSLTFFTLLLVKLAFKGWQSINSLRQCPQTQIGTQKVRLLDTQALFAGQIGFWKSELVISKGLLKTLDPAHLETVIAHEQGHYHYRDTFWFFWLGWVRECTAWLPNTNILWEELLLLRELRADAYAASRVDNLLLAESLLMVVSGQTPQEIEVFCAALGSSSQGERLERRIEALLNQAEVVDVQSSHYWHHFLLAFLPLITVLFHQ
ncbi:MAG: M56 family metallopeptidase [Calothrix sp. C42_A2020_038]|nr:M56 family metallopeptidase [Calothrix sp. C42_A2020_038]